MAFDMTTALTIKANVVGQGQVDKFGKSLDNVGKNSSKASTGLQKLASAGNSLTGVLARVGIAAAAGNFVRAGIEADRTSRRLVNLTKSFGETARVEKFAAEMADRYGLSQVAAANSVSDLFGRLRPMNVSLQQIQTVFKGVNTAAARMNLTTADTEGVMLQLSQALGSGKLQGDEFRSIMERLPAIGQAVATSMNVTVAELKKLSSDGMITTDVIIKALEKLAAQPPPEVDAYKQFQASLADLSATIGTQLLPALTPLIEVTNQLLGVFLQLPGPVQTLVAGAVALGAAFVVLAPAIAAVGPAFAAIAALKIGALFVSIGGAITAVGGILGGLLPILAGVFTGPVGWIALAAAAGIALYAFRDNIAAAFSGLVKAVQAPFVAIGNTVKAIFNNVIAFVGRRINAAINMLNRFIRIANRGLALIGAKAPTVPNVSLPRFAEGGVVSGPTVAMVGEGGEPEYIIPQSKMAHAAANYLGGARGRSVIPAFANGGVVGPGAAAGGTGGGAANTTVQITTGPVLQQDGQNYVTVADLESALKSFGNQVFRNSRTPGGRRYQGIYA